MRHAVPTCAMCTSQLRLHHHWGPSVAVSRRLDQESEVSVREIGRVDQTITQNSWAVPVWALTDD